MPLDFHHGLLDPLDSDRRIVPTMELLGSSATCLGDAVRDRRPLPAGGTAPDIAGQGVANPVAQILSASMMLRYSLDQGAAADAIDTAVEKALEDGIFTADIAPEGKPSVGTVEMGQAIVDRMTNV